jgi:preprotein translocase subunit SecA
VKQFDQPVQWAAPGPLLGLYPERVEKDPWTQQWFERLHFFIQGRTEHLQSATSTRSRARFVADVRSAQLCLPPVGSDAFVQALQNTRAELGRYRLQTFTPQKSLVTALAMVAQVLRAVLCIDVFDTQLIAAQILLDRRLAEMATGEGKTYSVMLAAATAALAGVPVHVITANSYLARRDAEQLAAGYAALDLQVCALQAADTDDQRRELYRCDVVYGTASDVIFDYLRDRDVQDPAQRRLRGLCMAIVDEADSVLIDQARTPFVLAGSYKDTAAEQRHLSALALARGLRQHDHFEIKAALASPRVELTDLGRQICLDAATSFIRNDPLWRNRRSRDELIELALTALHGYQKDVHYLVHLNPETQLDEIAIIDATTGRIAHGRRWSNGLHQLIELKESCAVSALQQTMAQLTFQRFFPRYWHLCGLSGTLSEARHELHRVYGLRVEKVPLRKACQRSYSAPRIHLHSLARWTAVAQIAHQLQAEGRPVLIGTDSVADSERLVEHLNALQVMHQRLDARQDQEEALRIAQAGRPGCVTVATNMAGRGTDITITDFVVQRGGLHIIVCQQNTSARIDRQLQGRAARGGDPGSVSTELALDQGLLQRRLPQRLRWGLSALSKRRAVLNPKLASALLWWVQLTEEQRARNQRAQLLEADRKTVRSLGFGSKME